MSPTLRHATTLWNFLCADRVHQPCDLIVVCGSYDLRVCEHACLLYQRGIAARMLMTGNRGNWTRFLWDRPEAEVFAERAQALGVPAQHLLLETRARNFAENIAHARAMCPQVRTATFVTKPNSVRRVALTQPIQWPGLVCHVDAPAFSFPDAVSNQIGVLGLIEEMVGDVGRILHYPTLGFQLPLPVPDAVFVAWRALIADGFDRHLP